MKKQNIPEEERGKIEKIEKNQNDVDYNKIKELLKKKSNGFTAPYILRQLHDKENLRKVFLAVVKQEPARISEIFEEALLTKPTCYAQLHKLLELNIVDRVFVSDIMNNNEKNHVDVKKKFEDWSKSMPEQLKRYYMAKTSFWKVSEKGKGFAGRAYHFDQEFREKQNKERVKNG